MYGLLINRKRHENPDPKSLIINYVYMIEQSRGFIYYDGYELHYVLLRVGKENDEFEEMVGHFVDDGGVAILRYTNPMHDGSVVVNGFISSGEYIERIPAKDLKIMMEKFEPEDRKKYYRYQLAFIHFPVSDRIEN